MRRAPFVIAGTIAGTAAVLAFPVEATHAVSLGAGASTKGVSGASTPTTSPAGTSASSTTSTSSTTTTAPSSTSKTGPQSATGADQSFRYGQLAVTVTLTNGKISNVSLATVSETDPRSASIDGYALPRLEQQVINADSANIDGVSGATFTSDAFVNSLTSALGKLGFK